MKVWNDARAIERCVDKSTTTFFLQKDGVPTPRTWTGVNREAASIAVTRARRRQAAGAEAAVRRARQRLAPDRLACRSRPARRGERRLLSAGIRSAGRRPITDWRLFVCQAAVVASMIRHGSSWITNIKQGARAEAAIPDQDLIALALRATSSVGADYAGVDIIEAPEGGFLVLEVNSMPAWNGLQRSRAPRSPISWLRPFSTTRSQSRGARGKRALERPLSSAPSLPPSRPPASPSSMRSSPAMCIATARATA